MNLTKYFIRDTSASHHPRHHHTCMLVSHSQKQSLIRPRIFLEIGVFTGNSLWINSDYPLIWNVLYINSAGCFSGSPGVSAFPGYFRVTWQNQKHPIPVVREFSVVKWKIQEQHGTWNCLFLQWISASILSLDRENHVFNVNEIFDNLAPLSWNSPWSFTI